MSTSQPEAVSPPAKPKRSPVERVIVQGGIVAGLILLGIEGWPYMQMKLAHAKLTAEMSKAELDINSKFTKDTVDQLLGRKPDDTKTRKAPNGEERYDIYYFNGLLKTRELCVHYGVQGMLEDKSAPEVMEVTTHIPDELLAL
jgi:hypothetical protein